MSVDPLQQFARLTQKYTVPLSVEPAVVISIRDYERLIERLEGCKPGGWGELWLAGVGAGVAVAMATLVTALTLPATLSATKDVLWAVTAAGAFLTVVCLLAYFTQRRDRAKEISELKKDLEMRTPKAASKAI